MEKMSLNDIKILIRSLNIRPDLNLGQVFLIDDQAIRRQVEFANLTKSDTVLEIGPGPGVLTKHLASMAGKVIAVEYDKALYRYLKDTMPPNVMLIHADALKLDFPAFNKLVANIPYQISSPLIFKLIDYDFDLAVIMFQAEFADRLQAAKIHEIGPVTTETTETNETNETNETTIGIKRYEKKRAFKTYSRLSVMAAYYYDIEVLSVVPKTSFYPVPKVESTLVRLIPKQKKDRTRAKNEQLFFNLVKVLFSQRRKMIKNTLEKNFNSLLPNLKEISKDSIKEFISRLPNPNQRPEELSLDQFIELSNRIDQAFNS